MKSSLFFILTLVLFSCSNKSNEPLPVLIKPSTVSQLEYPSTGGNSGDKVTSLLGYGYDSTGFCDSTSGRAKILDLSLLDINSDKINSTIPTFFSANNFNELTTKLSNSEIPQESFSSQALSAHLKSLVKLAYHTDSIDSKYAFSYYSITFVSPRFGIKMFSDLQKALSKDFQDDINLLTPQQLVAKYGTHVLTQVILGKKFEVLYSTESKDAIQAEHGLYQRMKQFMGVMPYIYVENYENKSKNINEKMIYNNIGGNKKMCGIINTTDNNPDKLFVDMISAINETSNLQFIEIGKNDLIPLSDLIKDPNKKQEIKIYIEQYTASKSDMK